MLLVLGFMALGRIRRPEGLRPVPPGEFGHVLGLDRVPEVRTRREKVRPLAQTGHPSGGMKERAKTGMARDPEAAGYRYVDGHVRVYHGALAQRPRRSVSRERWCRRGTPDYGINDALGRPFFVVTQAVNTGLADTLWQDIVPDRLSRVPGQPTPDALAADPRRHRFVIVLDREGATPSLLRALGRQRLGALTSRQNGKDVGPDSAFQDPEVGLPEGGGTRMRLAQRETRLGNGDDSRPVTEVRRLPSTGPQTAVITTARSLADTVMAGRLFARWCPENCLADMIEHFDMDGLLEYGVEPIPGTLEVVNPPWRHRDKAVRPSRLKVRKRQAQLTPWSLDEGRDRQQQAEAVEARQAVQGERDPLRTQRRATPRKVTMDRLPEAERPTQRPALNKILSDTVNMMAYRAETARVALRRRHLKKPDEARALIREWFVSSGDIEPDPMANTLTVRIHRMTSPVHDRAIAALLEELTRQEFQHPETGAKMIFALV
jgi:hypothetical protein